MYIINLALRQCYQKPSFLIIGIWDVLSSGGASEGVHLFRPHLRPINCLSFRPYFTHHLLTTSYEGTVRSADLQNLVFEEVCQRIPVFFATLACHLRCQNACCGIAILSLCCATSLVAEYVQAKH